VLLPIGMERPEPWLLDALDANLLLRALRAPPPGGAPIELVLYCMQVRAAAAYCVQHSSHGLHACIMHHAAAVRRPW